MMVFGLAMSFVITQAFAVTTPATKVKGDAAAGKAKSEVCGSCHGSDGNPSAPVFPKLAGQHLSYLTIQLQVFRSQSRANQDVMNAMAQSLTDQDIADISAWFSSNKLKPEPAEKNDLGQKIYRTGIPEKSVPACAACHGPKGEGNPTSVYPVLGGQYSSYISKNVHDFKAGERHNEVMQAVANRLSDDEINAVADFASGLQ